MPKTMPTGPKKLKPGFKRSAGMNKKFSGAKKSGKAPAQSSAATGFPKTAELDTIDKLGPAQERMSKSLELIDDIMGGTPTMRDAGEKWLPREALESRAAYDNRLNRSVFFNGYKRSVHTLVGKPFSKPIQFNPEVMGGSVESEGSDSAIPVNAGIAKLEKYLLDVDCNGRSFQVFVRELFIAGLADGITHYLVDYPKNTATNRKEEVDAGVRPYFVPIKACQIIDARATNVSGKWVLTHVRIMEKSSVNDGPWMQKEVDQIRVMEPGKYGLYQKREDPDNKEEEVWTLVEEGTTTLDEVPLITAYTNRVGFMEAAPPMLDLAYLNLHHWQSSSDQTHILHVARVPILFGKGFEETTADGETTTLEVGPNRFVTSSNPNADMKFVEHTGKACDAGQKDIESTENRMAAMGAEMLIRRQASPGPKTATQTVVDIDAEYSDLAVMALQIEDAAEEGLRLMAKWDGIDLPEGKFITINKDFGISLRDAADLQALLSMRAAGEITQRTLLLEYQRRGVLDPAIDIDDEIAAVREEPPKLSSFELKPGADPGNPDYHAPDPNLDPKLPGSGTGV